MNIKTIMLLASVFTVTSAIASPLTNNEIFSAIDGEYDHSESKVLLSNDVERVNFDYSPQSEANYKNTVTTNRTRFNFSLDVSNTVDPNETFEQAPILLEKGQRY